MSGIEMLERMGSAVSLAPRSYTLTGLLRIGHHRLIRQDHRGVVESTHHVPNSYHKLTFALDRCTLLCLVKEQYGLGLYLI